MAALSLRASWSPPTAVATPSRTARSIHIHPLGRRHPSSAPIKMQVRTRDVFLSHCQKRTSADGLPQPERGDDDHDTDEGSESVRPSKLVEEVLEYGKELTAAMGLPPDMFLKEQEQISDYMWKIPSSGDNQNVNERAVAKSVCATARTALDIASDVMYVADTAGLGLGTPEISQHTADQMVRMCATIFCNVAEDAYQMKIEMKAILSFLGAFRSLGAICHILVQDVVAKLKDGPLKNSITGPMYTNSQEFYKKLNDLEDEIEEIQAQEVQQTVMRILYDGLHYARTYVSWLVKCRKSALHHCLK
ncbi:hypothetical protein ACP70R_036928 [Stipagrostis hirtigluma subsp. patula]